MGGFDLGFELAGFEVVAQVEIDNYCRAELKHNFPTAKLYGDIREVTGDQIIRECGAIDVIVGGFPCQDISHAGKGAGLDGSRSGLWWEMHRLIGELKPIWVVAENVAALRARGLDRVKSSMEEMGYQVECLGIRAAAVGASHQRKRIWIVAHSNSNGRKFSPVSKKSRKGLLESDRQSNGVGPLADTDGKSRATSTMEGGSAVVAATAKCPQPGSDSELADTDSNGVREQSGWRCRQDGRYSPFNFPAGPGQQQCDWEEPRTIESTMGVTANGIPRKLALRAIGNSIIPAIAYGIARTISRFERVNK